jgi:hypothetical protein
MVTVMTYISIFPSAVCKSDKTSDKRPGSIHFFLVASSPGLMCIISDVSLCLKTRHNIDYFMCWETLEVTCVTLLPSVQLWKKMVLRNYTSM